MITSLEHAKAVQKRRLALKKRGVAKAVRRYFKAKGTPSEVRSLDADFSKCRANRHDKSILQERRQRQYAYIHPNAYIIPGRVGDTLDRMFGYGKVS